MTYKTLVGLTFAARLQGATLKQCKKILRRARRKQWRKRRNVEHQLPMDLRFVPLNS